MPIRLRLALVFGALGLVTVATVASLAYVFSAQEVRDSVDDQLVDRLGPFSIAPADGALAGGVLQPLDLEDDFGAESATAERALEAARAILDDPSLLEAEGDSTSIRILWDDGSYTGGPDQEPSTAASEFLADEADRVAQVSADSNGALDPATSPTPFFESASVNGVPYRVMTVGPQRDDLPALDGRELTGVQLWRDVSSEEQALDDLAVRLAIMSVLAAVVVGGAGLLVGRWLARPITELSTIAEELAELDDVPRRVEVRRNDEVGQMADSYNRLLSAIEVGREQQQRLVADASHEFRTPLTGLRMRLEYLQRNDIAPERRTELLDAAVDDAEQLSELASDLVDLAAAVRSTSEQPDLIVVGDVVDEVADRVRRRTGRELVVDVDETIAEVRPTMLRRALQNLIDNAVKYADGGPIEIRAQRGRIEVRDHGDGIPEEDLDHVFDRFFRSPKARNRPGNGIGLAIVRQVADVHGGDAWARNAADGGAIVGFSVDPAIDPAVGPAIDPTIDPAVDPAVDPSVDPATDRR